VGYLIFGFKDDLKWFQKSFVFGKLLATAAFVCGQFDEFEVSLVNTFPDTSQ